MLLCGTARLLYVRDLCRTVFVVRITLQRPGSFIICIVHALIDIARPSLIFAHGASLAVCFSLKGFAGKEGSQRERVETVCWDCISVFRVHSVHTRSPSSATRGPKICALTYGVEAEMLSFNFKVSRG